MKILEGRELSNEKLVYFTPGCCLSSSRTHALSIEATTRAVYREGRGNAGKVVRWKVSSSMSLCNKWIGSLRTKSELMFNFLIFSP